MQRQIGIIFGCAALVSAGLALNAQDKPVRVDLKDAQGQAVGHATISDVKSGGVSIALSLMKLPAGEHALHFHQTAKCEAPGFTSAGGHFNPEGKKHGSKNPEGHHAGDMANITVDKSGKLETKVTNAKVTLGTGDNSLFSNGGTALVIHAGADDMKTDPSGNAGDRIACGTITSAHAGR